MSIWPRAKFKFLNHDPTKNLNAVNGTKIKTYGTQRVQIKPQKMTQTYTHDVIVADIDLPIVGWDMIIKFKLDLVWKKGKCQLVDATRGQSSPLKLDTFDKNTLGLSLVTFRQYSQSKSEEYSKQEPKQPIPSQYKAIVDKYPEVLKVNFLEKPRHGVVHVIDTGQNRPCKATVRHLMPNTPKTIAAQKAMKDLEEIGVIAKVKADEPTTWSSPLHIAMKSDGTLRPVGDYRGLNSKTVADNYPLPNIRNFAAQMKNANFFTSLDLFRAYYNIELCEESQKKSTIVTNFGTFKYKRLAMGLKNSAASFQRLMSTILDGLPGVFCYLDDVLLFDKDESTHKTSLNKVLAILTENGLTLNLKKCQFAKQEIDFLGFRVSGSSITPLPKKMSAIAEYPPPTKPKQLLGFLGAVNFYRRSLPKVKGLSPAQILQPLYKAATRKVPGVKFV